MDVVYISSLAIELHRHRFCHFTGWPVKQHQICCAGLKEAVIIHMTFDYNACL